MIEWLLGSLLLALLQEPPRRKLAGEPDAAPLALMRIQNTTLGIACSTPNRLLSESTGELSCSMSHTCGQ